MAAVPSWLRLALLSLMWGSSFLFMKVGLEGLSPQQIVMARMIFGAAVLIVIVSVRREQLPRSGPIWGHLFALSVVANLVPFFLIAWGEESITSATAGVLNATTPLFTTLIAFAALRDERPTLEKAAGLAVGFAGVVVLLGGGGKGEVGGYLAVLGASACYGIAFVYMRRILSPTGLSPVVLSTGQIVAGAALMAALTPVVGRSAIHLDLGIVLSMVALGALGTGLAYPLSYSLVRDLGATGASLVTYLIPLAAVALGVVVLDEGLRWNLPIGGAVVIIGVALAQGRFSRDRQLSEDRDVITSLPIQR